MASMVRDFFNRTHYPIVPLKQQAAANSKTVKAGLQKINTAHLFSPLLFCCEATFVTAVRWGYSFPFCRCKRGTSYSCLTGRLAVNENNGKCDVMNRLPQPPATLGSFFNLFLQL